MLRRNFSPRNIPTQCRWPTLLSQNSSPLPFCMFVRFVHTRKFVTPTRGKKITTNKRITRRLCFVSSLHKTPSSSTAKNVSEVTTPLSQVVLGVMKGQKTRAVESWVCCPYKQKRYSPAVRRTGQARCQEDHWTASRFHLTAGFAWNSVRKKNKICITHLHTTKTAKATAYFKATTIWGRTYDGGVKHGTLSEPRQVAMSVIKGKRKRNAQRKSIEIWSDLCAAFTKSSKSNIHLSAPKPSTRLPSAFITSRHLFALSPTQSCHIAMRSDLSQRKLRLRGN